jgi:ankyrin repeat protein
MASESQEQLTEEDHAEVLECARYGELEDLQTLLELGANANYADEGGSTALHKAAGNGSVDILRLLHKYGAKYTANASGNTPLHWACLNGQKSMVEGLLELYPDVDIYAKNQFGRSAFTEALAAGHEEIGRIMLTHASADPAMQAAKDGECTGAGAAVGEEEDEGEDEGEDEEADLLAAGDGAEEEEGQQGQAEGSAR